MSHTAATLIAFESRIVSHFAAGAIPCLIHLSGGNEAELLELFATIRPHDWVFSSHRNHYHALLKGIPEAHLEAEILAGRSMFIYSREHNFITSSILAGTCAIAAGVAWDLAQKNAPGHVWCFLGDGAEEQGHFYEAVLFAEANYLPITFVIEDNDRQVDTSKADRQRGTYHPHHVRCPLDHFNCVERYHYAPTYPHGGAGLPPGSVTFQPEAIARLRAAS
jgi:TPP-dependent pyruvate/acetoin dehydrogenase alpha subunit